MTEKKKINDVLSLSLDLLDKYYDEREKTCRDFKWICHDYLPQGGEIGNKTLTLVRKIIKISFKSLSISSLI